MGGRPSRRSEQGPAAAVAAAPTPARARGSVAASIRANLFRGHLTRRLAPAGSASTAVAAAAAAGDVLHLEDGDAARVADASEIVVRNQHGEIELGDPPTPTVDKHDEQAEDRHEVERERKCLAEAVKHHSINRTSVPVQPEELLEAVRADLRAKVCALADDNWMFESEEPTRS